MTLMEDLADYSGRSANLLSESPQMDEENTKRKVIEPLIELLGWDILSSDVELEYSVQMGSGTKKVDYSLKLEGTPVVFVEAKGADTDLTEGDEKQLRSYMRQVGVDWGLLSNGRTFKIFRRDFSTNRPNEISLAEFQLAEIEKKTQPLTALTKGSLESGESRQIAEKIEAVQNAVDSLREDKEEIAEKVTTVVTKQIGESVSQWVENEAKSFVDDLVSSLEDQAHKAKVRPEPESKPKQGDGYEIKVLKEGSEIKRVSGRTQGAASAALVNYLIEEHGLLQVLEVPYIPGTGRGDRALINEEPIHKDGREMRLYEELDEGYYLYTSLSKEDKERYLTELPQKLGLECKFVVW